MDRDTRADVGIAGSYMDGGARWQVKSRWSGPEDCDRAAAAETGASLGQA